MVTDIGQVLKPHKKSPETRIKENYFEWTTTTSIHDIRPITQTFRDQPMKMGFSGAFHAMYTSKSIPCLSHMKKENVVHAVRFLFV
jgi:hypothetical protein